MRAQLDEYRLRSGRCAGEHGLWNRLTHQGAGIARAVIDPRVRNRAMLIASHGQPGSLSEPLPRDPAPV